MKHSNNINRAICWLMAMALAMLPTLAQGSRQVISTADGKQYCLTSSQPDIKWEQRGDTWHPVKKAPQKTEPTEGAVTVTCEWEYGDLSELYYYIGPAQETMALNEDGQIRTCERNKGIPDYNRLLLEPGRYDFLSVHAAYGEESAFYCLIKENVPITSDTTLVFDFTECQLLEVKNYNVEGELFEPRNTYDVASFGHGLIRKNDGGFLSLRPITTTIMPQYYLNEISDRFLLMQSSIYNIEAETENQYFYVIGRVAENIEEPWISNPQNFAYVEQTFNPSKVSSDTQYKSAGINILATYNNDKPIVNQGMGSLAPNVLNTVRIYVDLPKHNSDVEGVNLFFDQDFGDFFEIWDITPMGDVIGMPHDISAPVSLVENNEMVYSSLGCHSYPVAFYSNYENNLLPIFKEGNPFTFTQSQMKQNFGSSVPILVNMHTRSFSETDHLFPMGRYGEERKVDCNYNNTFELRKNGETIWAEGTWKDRPLDLYYQEPLGVMDQIYDLFNVDVDGLEGHNFTTVHYDENNDDSMAPTLTMLWFKDGDDITDRFNTSSDGLLEFSANDFNWHPASPNIDTAWALSQPMSSVEVSYSPYQADTWNELAVDEVPENVCSPGYGYFYRGSLAGVTGEALKGWFDLKVKLTDAAGNWQEQIISPAFRIDDLAYTSVANIGSDNAHEVARYSIDGKRVDAYHRGVTIIRMSDGTARKIQVK